MMNRKDFFDYVAENVKDYLPHEYDNANISVEEVVKNNDTVLHGLTIRKENEIATPTIYLEDFYREYQKGKSIDDIVGDVADLRIEKDAPSMDHIADMVKNYDNVKDKLSIRICDPDLNQEMLAGKACTMHGDFSATYHIVFAENENETASCAVSEKFLDMWKVPVEQIHQDAMTADQKRGPILATMGDMMEAMVFADAKPRNLLEDRQSLTERDLEYPMFCLTNSSKVNAASLILNEDITARIGEILGSDYYILPSSIHETLIVSDTTDISLAELEDMVRTVNATEVAPNEILSDKVQHYDRKDHILENAHTFEERKLSKEKERPKGIKERLSEAKKSHQEKAADKNVNQHKDKSKGMEI